jgi:ABC-type sugar transport system, periplasmic component
MKKRKLLAAVLAATMVIGSLTACTGGSETTEKKTESTTEKGTTEKATSDSTETGSDAVYPLQGGSTITYWADLNTSVSPNYASLSETPFGQGLMENTGVTIDFLHPPSGMASENFSLMIADGDLPDVIEYAWLNDYPGGPQKAIDDGIIVPLNDIMDEYAPNLKAYLEANPHIDKLVKTDEGNYYAFPFIRGDIGLLNTIGLMVRQDWLDELGLEVPTTIDEWHTVLTAFKDKGVASPFVFEYTMLALQSSNPFMYAYGTNREFFIGSDELVHFGPMEPGYKEYLATFAQWYAEGLIDADIATQGLDQVSAKMTSDTAGASIGWAGSRLGVWTNSALATNPDFELVPAPVPTLTKGGRAEMGPIESQYPAQAAVAITTSCKDVETAARLLDWAYSEEGHLYYNFGVEGVSYDMVDGYPAYKEEVLNHPDGWPRAQSLAANIRGNYNGPFVQDVRYLEQFLSLPAQKDSINIWGDHNGVAYRLPSITPTSEESSEFAMIMNEINTYRDEMTIRFILGTESLDNYDNFIKTLETMGIERAIEIQNAAYTRYKAR